jgi:branched-chain amino acid transport system substrate-binding protein
MSIRATAKRRHITAGLGCSVVLAAGLTGCGASGSGSGGVGEVRIGLVFPTSGSMAALGADQNGGAKMMLNWANAHGGVGGAKIKIFEADSQSDPGVGATAAQRLIDRNRVQIIIGSYGSGIAQAMVPVAQRNRVLLWEVGAVSPTINKAGSPGFLRTVGASATYAAADIDFLENYLAGKLKKPANQVTIAIAHEDGAFGSSVGNEIAAQAKAKGLNIVANEAYSETSSDLTPVVLRLKAKQPDVLFITPLVASTPLFWQAARAQDFNVKAIVGSAGFSSSSFLAKFGAKGIEGVFDVEAPAVEYMKSDNLAGDARAVLDELRTQFKTQQGHPCLVHCGDGLGGTYVLVKDVLPRAIKSGSLSMASIEAAARKTDIPDGGTPQGFGVKFGAKGDNERAKSYIMQWQGGKLRVVYPSTLAVADPIFPLPTWAQR